MFIGIYAIEELLKNLKFIDYDFYISDIKFIKLFQQNDIPICRFSFNINNANIIEFPSEYFSQILVDNNWLNTNEFILNACYLPTTGQLKIDTVTLETEIRTKGILTDNKSYETTIKIGDAIDEKVTKEILLDKG
jgi:hypothetical protein